MTLADKLKAQIARDRQQWEALSPTVRKALENELAAMWPNFPRPTPTITAEDANRPPIAAGGEVETMRSALASIARNSTDGTAKQVASAALEGRYLTGCTALAEGDDHDAG